MKMEPGTEVDMSPPSRWSGLKYDIDLTRSHAVISLHPRGGVD